MGEPRLVVVRDPDALAVAGAGRVRAALSGAIEERGVAHLVLTGGSTAGPLYAHLAPDVDAAAVDWSRVHIWWGDERSVPADHPESNSALASRTLLRLDARAGQSGEGAGGTDLRTGLVPGPAVPVGQLHPIPVGLGIQNGRGDEWTAEEYAREIRTTVAQDGRGRPVFDLILAGVGPDGHILSLFPGRPTPGAGGPVVIAVPAPETVEPRIPRVTLAPVALEAAREVLVMAAGQGKAEILAEVLGGPRDVLRLPAQLARRENATWLLDEAAASRLPR